MSKPANILTLGEGKVVVAHGYYDFLPALFLAPAKNPGEIGAEAVSESNAEGGLDDAVVIRFASMEAVFLHLERLKMMIEKLQLDLEATDEGAA